MLISGSWIYYVFALVSAGAITLLCARILIRAAVNSQLFLDQPDKRRLHPRAVPRSGGLAVYLGFQITCLALMFLVPGFDALGAKLTTHWWASFTVAATLLVLVGLFDDAFGIAWYCKLLAQVAAAMFLYSEGVSVDSIIAYPLLPWQSVLATVIWFVAIINAFNLIDGLDGLAAGLAICGAIGLMAITFVNRTPGDTVLLVGFIGACLGFLRYNFHPARIFLGDSGSMFLGLTLASVALIASAKSTVLTSLMVPLLAVGVPLFDTTLAIWRRSVRAMAKNSGIRHVVQADMEHIHHRLVQTGLTQRKVALVLYGAGLALVGVATLSLIYNARASGILFISILTGLFLAARHIARTELWDSGRLILQGVRRPASPVVSTVLYPLMDFVALNAVLMAVVSLTWNIDGAWKIKERYFELLPIWVGVPFLSLALSGTYNRVWSRARVSEFVTLAAVLCGACAINVTIVLFGSEVFPDSRSMLIHTVLYYSLSAGFIVTIRAIPRSVRDIMSLSLSRGRSGEISGSERILIYGAGMRCLLFLRNLTYLTQRGESSPVVAGFIDDEVNLRKRIVHGHKVLGTGDELPAILTSTKATKIILTCDLPEGRFEELRRVCRLMKIRLTEWRAKEEDILAGGPGMQVEKIVMPKDQSAGGIAIPEDLLPGKADQRNL